MFTAIQGMLKNLKRKQSRNQLPLTECVMTTVFHPLQPMMSAGQVGVARLDGGCSLLQALVVLVCGKENPAAVPPIPHIGMWRFPI